MKYWKIGNHLNVQQQVNNLINHDAIEYYTAIKMIHSEVILMELNIGNVRILLENPRDKDRKWNAMFYV